MPFWVKDRPDKTGFTFIRLVMQVILLLKADLPAVTTPAHTTYHLASISWKDWTQMNVHDDIDVTLTQFH